MSQDHSHTHSANKVSDGVLLWSVIINAGLSVFEFVAGLLSGSVALMADALHNTNDAAALIVAYIARKISKTGADYAYTFGYRRAELIGAMIQLTALIVVGLYLIYEAVRRLYSPEPLEAGWIMLAAGIALLVDVVTAWLLWAMSKGSLNVKAAFLHNLTDAGASLAVLLAGVAISWFGWNWVDPILTLVIAAYILYMSFGMLKKTSRILMEGTPLDLSLEEVADEIRKIRGVNNVHHLHVWELDESHRALECHVVVTSLAAEHSELRFELKQMLRERFAIDHTTIELEGPDDSRRCENQDLVIPH